MAWHDMKAFEVCKQQTYNSIDTTKIKAARTTAVVTGTDWPYAHLSMHICMYTHSYKHNIGMTRPNVSTERTKQRIHNNNNKTDTTESLRCSHRWGNTCEVDEKTKWTRIVHFAQPWLMLLSVVNIQENAVIYFSFYWMVFWDFPKLHNKFGTLFYIQTKWLAI